MLKLKKSNIKTSWTLSSKYDAMVRRPIGNSLYVFASTPFIDTVYTSSMNMLRRVVTFKCDEPSRIFFKMLSCAQPL